MPEPIKPALSAEEWADPKIRLPPTFDPAEGVTLYRDDDCGLVLEAGDSWYSSLVPPDLAPKLIALLNASLPDSDPRKITRACVRRIRQEAERFENTSPADDGRAAPDEQLTAIADALESYLPRIDIAVQK